MTLEAYRCENGHVFRPVHRVCPECGADLEQTIDLTDRTGTILTWTTATATPPGVRQPNHLAIVAFDVGGDTVQTLGQLTTGNVETGDPVEPVYVEQLRDPDEGIRHPDSQDWDGYRFKPVD